MKTGELLKKAVALLSDGIDSPVACHIAMENGYQLVVLICDNHPFSSKEMVETSKRLVMRLSQIHGQTPKFYVARNGENLRRIIGSLSGKDISYTCVLCKRVMIRLADKLADKEEADFILTGENLGQVASQTLDNMVVISKATKRHILRPLLCMDKIEIEQIAKEIGTYEISIESKSLCKAVPKYPQTKASHAKVEAIEKEIELSVIFDQPFDFIS
ncbi:MAG: tRNA sulfurtransferase [Candidatus Methanofastidiosia archaeon]